MDLDQLQIVWIRFFGDFLNGVGFGILNKYDVLAAVVEPAEHYQLIKEGWLNLRRNRRNKRERIALPYLLIAIGLEACWNIIVRLAEQWGDERHRRQHNCHSKWIHKFTGSGHTSGQPPIRG